METQADKQLLGLIEKQADTIGAIIKSIEMLSKQIVQTADVTVSLAKRLNDITDRQVEFDERLLQHSQVIRMNNLKTPRGEEQET